MVLALVGILGRPGAADVVAPDHAEAADDRTVVFLALSGGDDDSRPMATVLQAHLAPCGMRLAVRTVAASPGTPAARAELARRILLEEPIHAVVWMERDHARVFVVLATPLGSPRLVERLLPPGIESSGSFREIVASIVRSVLDSEEEAPPPEGPARAPAAIVQWGDWESPPLLSGNNSEQEGDARFPMHLLARTGYGLLLAQGSRTVNHAPTVAIGLELGRVLDLELAAAFPRATAGDPLPDRQEPQQLARLPLRMDLRWRLPLGRLELTPGAGLILDLLSTGPVRDMGVVEGFDGAHPGAGLTLLTQLRPTSWLGIWIEMGADIYFGAHVHQVDVADEVAGETERFAAVGYGPFQGRVTAGVALLASLFEPPRDAP